MSDKEVKIGTSAVHVIERGRSMEQLTALVQETKGKKEQRRKKALGPAGKLNKRPTDRGLQGLLLQCTYRRQSSKGLLTASGEHSMQASRQAFR